MRVNELLLEAISTAGFQFVSNSKTLEPLLGDFEDQHFFGDLAEEIEKLFPRTEGYKYGQFDKLELTGGRSGYVNEKTGEVVLTATPYVYRNVDTGVGKHYGYQKFMLQLNIKLLVRKGVLRQIELIAKQKDESSGITMREKGFVEIFSATKSSAKVSTLIAMLKDTKKAFLKDQDELHKKMEAIRNQALNAIHKVQPEKNFPQEDQTEQFFKFGKDLKKLVAKYAEFNVDGQDVNAGYYGSAKLTSHKSGKIEFAEQYTHHGDYYQGSHAGSYAVKLGTNYPADKAEAFAVEYMKLVKKTLPVEMPVNQGNGDIKQKPVRVTTADGTAFSTFMITF